MYTDKELQLADTQVSSAVGDNPTTEVIDVAVVDRNIGIGEQMALVYYLDALPDVGDADETYEFRIEVAIDEAFSSPKVLVSRLFSNAEAAALKLIDKIVLNFPSEDLSQQFVRGNIFTAGTTPSITTTVFMQPTETIQNEFRKGHPSGFKVS